MIKKVKHRLHILLMVVGLLPMMGCTVSTNYYFRNLSEYECEVTMVAKEELGENIFEINYIDSVVENLKYSSHLIFDKKITPKSIENKIIFKVLPNSTVYIGQAKNFNLYFEKIIISQGVRKITINPRELSDFKYKRELLKYVVWYDLE